MHGSRARRIAAAAAVSVALGVVRPASGDDYFQADPDPVTFRLELERTRTQNIALLSLFGGSVVFAGAALAFHLDSRSKADDVSATGSHTGHVYTTELDDRRRAAIRSRNLAIGGYAIASGLAVAGIVLVFVTDPGTQGYRYGPNGEMIPVGPHNLVVPVAGGALIGRAWEF